MNKKGISDKTLLNIMWGIAIGLAIYLGVKIIQSFM